MRVWSQNAGNRGASLTITHRLNVRIYGLCWQGSQLLVRLRCLQWFCDAACLLIFAMYTLVRTCFRTEHPACGAQHLRHWIPRSPHFLQRLGLTYSKWQPQSVRGTPSVYYLDFLSQAPSYGCAKGKDVHETNLNNDRIPFVFWSTVDHSTYHGGCAAGRYLTVILHTAPRTTLVTIIDPLSVNPAVKP